MKLVFTSLLICILAISAFAQNTTSNKQTPPPSPQDGNGYLGQSYSFKKCGLDYTQASIKLCQRVTLNPGPVQPVTLNISSIPANAVIEKAFLYTGTSGNGVAITASVTNPSLVNALFPMLIIGQDTDKCWGYAGTYSYRADVTSIVTGNGNYILSGLPTDLTDPLNDVDGATLLIIYSDPLVTTWKGEIKIKDGAWVQNYGGGWGTNFGYVECNSNFANSFVIVADQTFVSNIVFWSLNSTIVQNPQMWNFFQSDTGFVPQGNWFNQISTNFNNNECCNVLAAAAYVRTTCCTGCNYTPLTMNFGTVTVDCLGNCNGNATANPSGGVPPYSYAWNTIPVQTTQTVTGLCAGIYSVTVTDVSGCTLGVTDSAIITSPTLLTALTPTIVEPSCNGMNNGSATANPIGGTAPYNYVWNIIPAQSSQTATGLAAGSYTITITDAGNCTINTIVIVTQPAILSVSLSQNPINCSGACNGLISAQQSGGTPPFSYLWSTGETNGWIDSLCAGTYSLVVTDTNGCSATAAFVMTQPSTPLTVTTTQTNITCYFFNNGSATVFPSGGVPPYTYFWMPTGGTNQTATGLNGISYTVTVSDSAGCSIQMTVTITQPPFLNTPSLANVTICLGQSVTLSQTNNGGGTAPYTYTWNPGNIIGSSIVASPTATTTYTVACVDANGCAPTPRTVIVYVIPGPQAAFISTPLYSTAAPSQFCFTNTSTSSNAWTWNFGTGYGASSQQDACITFNDTGRYCVVLTAFSNTNQCSDSVMQCVDIVGIIIPNVFTPDGDGVNDVWKITCSGYSRLRCAIYNRWGTKIYELKDTGDFWDGYSTSGMPCTEGVYYYVLFAEGESGNAFEEAGFLHLLRIK